MCRIDKKKAGFTLTELMVAVGLGGLVMLSCAGFVMYASRSYVAMSNYSSLDRQGQLATDRFTQQVRQVKRLTSYNTDTNGVITTLTFNDYDDQPLTFTYNPSLGILSRIKGPYTNLFLWGCDSLQFTIYQRNPQPFTFDAVTTAVATNCKLVQVTWTCSRNIFHGDKANTQSAQSVKVAIRGG